MLANSKTFSSKEDRLKVGVYEDEITVSRSLLLLEFERPLLNSSLSVIRLSSPPKLGNLIADL
jgi:hypothetical protein